MNKFRYEGFWPMARVWSDVSTLYCQCACVDDPSSSLMACPLARSSVCILGEPTLKGSPSGARNFTVKTGFDRLSQTDGFVERDAF